MTQPDLGAVPLKPREPIALNKGAVWIYFFSDKCQLLISKYGLHEWATNSVDLHRFARMLAKIAHGYTVGELGINGFDHILPN